MNKNKKNKKVFTNSVKVKYLTICFISLLMFSIVALAYAPIPIGVMYTLSLVLCVIVFKKKTVEEKQVEQMKNLIKEQKNDKK